jgi:allophanate hydrolase
VLPACRSLDCVSIFALTVEDASEALAVIEGPDPLDIYSRFAPGPAELPARLRVGVPMNLHPSVDAASAQAFAKALAQLKELGHEAVPVDFSTLDAVADLLYEGPWVAERHWVVKALMDERPEALDPTVRQVIGRASRFTATDTFAAQYRLREFAPRAEAIWQEVDLLLVPTAPRHPTHADLAADPVGANTVLGRFTNFVNLLGWCALALPSSVRPDGLPFGVTAIAPGGLDAALARFGQLWQAHAAPLLGATGDALRLPVAPPLRWPASEVSTPVAVVGAHLEGLPLNSQLTERGAVLAGRTRSAPHYRLYELPYPGTGPRKPGLLRVNDGGAAVELEVWNLPQAAVGSFMALVPAPLSIGRVQLEDGRQVHGFLCEPAALVGARDITAFGGWRAYLASLA